MLSVPKRLRYFPHRDRDPKAGGAVLHILLRALRRTLREMLGWDHGAPRGAWSGFSLDASVRIPAHDRAGLERLPRPAPDGRTLIRLSPLELLDRLAARPASGGCPPPPRVHRHRCHGVLAPNSPLRSAVVASAGEAATFPQSTPSRPVSTFSRRSTRSNSRRVSSRRAALVARIHHARPLVCPGPSVPLAERIHAVLVAVRAHRCTCLGRRGSPGTRL